MTDLTRELAEALRAAHEVIDEHLNHLYQVDVPVTRTAKRIRTALARHETPDECPRCGGYLRLTNSTRSHEKRCMCKGPAPESVERVVGIVSDEEPPRLSLVVLARLAKEQEVEITSLRAENERLRSAMQRVAYIMERDPDDPEWSADVDAFHAALAHTPPDSETESP